MDYLGSHTPDCTQRTALPSLSDIYIFSLGHIPGKEVLKHSNLRPPNAAFMVQSVVRVLVPVHVPPPLPPINNAFDRCQGTIRAQKQAHGALQTVQSRMAAQKISCAKTGGAAKSRKKHPQN